MRRLTAVVLAGVMLVLVATATWWAPHVRALVAGPVAIPQHGPALIDVDGLVTTHLPPGTLPLRASGVSAPKRITIAASPSTHCIASHYGYDYRGNPRGAASTTYPHGTRVLVRADNGRSVVVTINDSGPYVGGRCIDLARSAFAQLAPPSAGLVGVSVSRA